MINDALHKYLNICVIAYLDDILIFLKTEKEHQKHVETVLTYLEKRKLLLKTEKCKFHKYKMSFFRFIIKYNEIHLNLKKIRSVTE